jgi:hypothetical protein
LSAALCAFLLASGVMAQGGTNDGRPASGRSKDAELNEQKTILRDRNRSSLHPGDPLAIVGVEEGDNDIRSRTPALMHSDRHAGVVDVDREHQRRLALFEGGGLKLEPVTIARDAPAETRTTTRPRAEEPDVAPTRDPRLILLCAGIVAFALVSVWAYKRFASGFTRQAA